MTRRVRAAQKRSRAAVREDLVEVTRVDARGLCAVLGAWAAAIWLPRGDPVVSGLAALCACLGVALALGLLWRNSGVLSLTAHWWGPLVVALAGFAAVGVPLALSAGEQQAPALLEHLNRASEIRAEMTLISEPRARDKATAWGKPEPGAVVVDARVDRFFANSRWHSSDVPVALSIDPSDIRAPGVVLSTSDPEHRVESFSRGDRLLGVFTLDAAATEERHRYWASAAAPFELVAAQHGGVIPELRRQFVDAASPLPDPGRALLPGMVMGDRSGQGEELDAAMKSTGLAHLTAVSGSNCAMITGAVLWLTRLLHAPRLLGFVASIAALVGFVALVGVEPSVIRAAVMGGIAAAAVFGGRGRRALTSLCLCIVVLIAATPDLALEIGFQLSVLATGGIVLLGRPLALILERFLPTWLAGGIAISVAAQLFCQPVLLQLTPSFATYSVLANLLVTPLVPVVTILGTLALVLSFLPGVLLSPLVWVAGLAAHAVGVIGTTIAGWPAASVAWPEGWLGVVLAISVLACALISVWLITEQPRQGVLSLVAACASVAILGASVAPATRWAPNPETPDWQAAACDVGQGDAVVLNAGGGAAVMIDVGEDPELVKECLRRLGVQRITELFITHLHADHVGAWRDLVEETPVGQISYSTSDMEGAASWIQEVSEATGMMPRKAARGQSGVAGLVSWQVLSPESGEVAASENDASLVLAAEVSMGSPDAHRLTLLLTGDIEQEAMSALISRHGLPDVDVLKVAHHGAVNGGLEVLRAATPDVAFVSVGAENTYGHPARQILSGFKAAQVPLYRTDTQGTILLSLQSGSVRAEITIVATSMPRDRIGRRTPDRRIRWPALGPGAPSSRRQILMPGVQ